MRKPENVLEVNFRSSFLTKLSSMIMYEKGTQQLSCSTICRIIRITLIIIIAAITHASIGLISLTEKGLGMPESAFQLGRRAS